jgi:hypothetical protein
MSLAFIFEYGRFSQADTKIMTRDVCAFDILVKIAVGDVAGL